MAATFVTTLTSRSTSRPYEQSQQNALMFQQMMQMMQGPQQMMAAHTSHIHSHFHTSHAHSLVASTDALTALLF